MIFLPEKNFSYALYSLINFNSECSKADKINFLAFKNDSSKLSSPKNLWKMWIITVELRMWSI